MFDLMSRVKDRFRREHVERERRRWKQMVDAPHLAVARKQHALPGQLVVSLTSHPPRFQHLYPTLRCLLQQSVQADRLILWVGEGQRAKLSPKVLDLERHGLEVAETADIGPATKILPTLSRHPEAFIVSADDDLFYPDDWLETLVGSYDHANPAIVARRAHLALTDEGGYLLPYDAWEKQTTLSKASRPGTYLFPTGVGGVLYPPHSLPAAALDTATMRRVCPKADDIWLFWMARRAGAQHTRAPGQVDMINWMGSQVVSLRDTNVVQNGNDPQIKAMEREFGLLGDQGVGDVI